VFLLSISISLCSKFCLKLDVLVTTSLSLYTSLLRNISSLDYIHFLNDQTMSRPVLIFNPNTFLLKTATLNLTSLFSNFIVISNSFVIKIYILNLMSLQHQVFSNAHLFSVTYQLYFIYDFVLSKPYMWNLNFNF